MPHVLIISDDESERLHRYANPAGVRGGWQNLSDAIDHRRLVIPPNCADAELGRLLREAIERMAKRDRGLFGGSERGEETRP